MAISAKKCEKRITVFADGYFTPCCCLLQHRSKLCPTRQSLFVRYEWKMYRWDFTGTHGRKRAVWRQLPSSKARYTHRRVIDRLLFTQHCKTCIHRLHVGEIKWAMQFLFKRSLSTYEREREHLRCLRSQYSPKDLQLPVEWAGWRWVENQRSLRYHSAAYLMLNTETVGRIFRGSGGEGKKRGRTHVRRKGKKAVRRCESVRVNPRDLILSC
jgi:hypothetical protein